MIDVADLGGPGVFLGHAGRVGLGLVGIQERIRELGGWFAARNRDSGGTILTAEIPSEVPVVGHA